MQGLKRLSPARFRVRLFTGIDFECTIFSHRTSTTKSETQKRRSGFGGGCFGFSLF